MKGILIVDHGSQKAEANDMLRCMSNLLQTMAGPEVIVGYAHMELADPDIATAFADCVRGGASDVTVFPYMLSPGRHSTTDIPRMVSDAARGFPQVTFSVTPAFGVHEKLAELVLDRAGVEPIKAFAGSEADHCWDPECSEKLCGDACRAKTGRATHTSTTSKHAG
ncbi:MAG TPA: CbiX/SirB N-terminal domain-containing protein [Gemmatimonadaceae bacterium]|jgi:sirohydrochlorin ferrochelatase|nr:CbiX/SirB N-terminal domain-containing protein [Gemmatimonadaceae bacterium]